MAKTEGYTMVNVKEHELDKLRDLKERSGIPLWKLIELSLPLVEEKLKILGLIER